MKAVVQRVVARTQAPIAVEEIDISTDRELEARYGLEIPVLLVDGKKAAKYRVDGGRSWRRIAADDERETAGRMSCRRRTASCLAFQPCSPALHCQRLLRRDHEVAAAVLLPAGFVLVAADRLFLALADHGERGWPARRG